MTIKDVKQFKMCMTLKLGVMGKKYGMAVEQETKLYTLKFVSDKILYLHLLYNTRRNATESVSILDH